MSQMLRLIFFSIALSSLGAEPAVSQSRPVPEDQIKLGQKFFAQYDECRNLLRNKQWVEAEAACKVTTQLADRFADHRELEKMEAYASVGHALMGQERYADAIKYYTRALEVSRLKLNDTNAEVGSMYRNIAMAYHSLGELDEARKWYRKAEGTYQIAYTSIKEEEVTEEGVEMKRGYLKVLKQIFEYHLRAAEQAGASAEVEEIKKQMASLP